MWSALCAKTALYVFAKWTTNEHLVQLKLREPFVRITDYTDK
jgi:hypothetical protein